MGRAVGPFEITERQKRFYLCKDRAIISSHPNFHEAEDHALQLWLDHTDEEDSETNNEPRTRIIDT
jgi:hypothetical protein